MPMGPLWSEHAYVRTSSGEAARGRASLLVMGAEKRLCPDHRGVCTPTCERLVGKRHVGVPHSSFWMWKSGCVGTIEECARLRAHSAWGSGTWACLTPRLWMRFTSTEGW